jgi:uncharacterized membrane protein YphA (DoxX/SURF4 family)
LRIVSKANRVIDKFDSTIIKTLNTIAIPFARFALGLIFIWFGALKTIGELSPAYDLVAATVYWLTPEIIVPLVGLWEVAIGIAFLVPALTRLALVLLAGQMPATFIPLIALPEVCFTVIPFGLTLEGQYIVKNLVIIAAALIIGGTTVARERKRAALAGPPFSDLSTS